MNFVKKIAILLLSITILGCFSACRALAKEIVYQLSSESSSGKSDLDKKIYGEWVTEIGTLFVINEDGTCGWYKSKDDRKDNYYSGKKITVMRGDEALNELEVDKEEQKRNDFYRDPSNVFSVRMYYDCLKSGGVDKSDTIKKGSYQWLMFKIMDTKNYNKALAYDLNTDQTYELTKQK